MKGEKRPQPSPARLKEDEGVPSFDSLLHPLGGGVFIHIQSQHTSAHPTSTI